VHSEDIIETEQLQYCA